MQKDVKYESVSRITFSVQQFALVNFRYHQKHLFHFKIPSSSRNWNFIVSGCLLLLSLGSVPVLIHPLANNFSYSSSAKDLPAVNTFHSSAEVCRQHIWVQSVMGQSKQWSIRRGLSVQLTAVVSLAVMWFLIGFFPRRTNFIGQASDSETGKL